MRKAIFTIVSNNYLHYARTLLQSVAPLHPECDRFCVLVDRDDSHAKSYADEFAVIRLEQLSLPQPSQFAFRYSILELNTAVKPWAFAYLLSLGYTQVVYLDPDIQLHRPMVEVFDLLGDEAEIVITPHLLAPMTDTKLPSELDIRRAGTYNFGFCGIAAGSSSREFLEWWQSKLIFGCIVDLAAGIFVDQSWIDLVPGLFPKVAILRHPGYNVAYWNLAQRAIERGPEGYSANGRPLVFFHFSGFNAEDPGRFSKHQNRYAPGTLGDASKLVIDYAADLIRNGARRMREIPYGYGTFADGITPIPDAFRRAYRSDATLVERLGDDPFADPSILWTVVPATRGHLAPTYLMQSMWNERPDLQSAFSLKDDESVIRFFDWFSSEGYPGSPTIQERHLAVRAAVDRSFRGTNPGERRSTAAARSAREQFIDRLFSLFLAREADASGREHYARVVAARGGIWRVLLSIGLSRESRARPGLLGRMRVGVRDTIGAWAFGLNHDRRQPAWVTRPLPPHQPRPPEVTQAPANPRARVRTPVEGINLVGYLAAESGVGESVRSFALGCQAAGLRCATFDVGYQNLNRQNDRSIDRLPTEDRFFDISLLHVNADQMAATLAALPTSHREAAVKIAYWHWEQPTLPISALAAFEGLTEVWVPSGFVRDAVASIATIPVFKVPHVIEFAVPSEIGRAHFGLPSDRFLVLTMYDFDSYQYRKNPQAAIEAYRRACGERTGSALVIKTINADRDPAGHAELLAKTEGMSDVYFIDTYLDRSEVHALEQACDCFISLHRAEGFGLALAEMMYLGKPVIGTGWSGNMEFMTSMNSFPVEYELKPLLKKLGPYEAGQLWAEADIDHAARELRRVLDDQPLRRLIGQAAAKHMRDDYSAIRIGERYRRRFDLLANRFG